MMPVSSHNSPTRMLSILIHANIFLIQFTLSNRLTSILISRFLLNLQAVDKRSTGMVSSTGSQVESAIFERVIGSLGSEIEFGADVDVDGMEEDDARAGDSGVGDMENSLSGLEHPEEGATWAATDN